MNDKARAAVITGGASGLGAATARRLVAEGFAATLFDRDEETGIQAATDIGCTFANVDVTDEASVKAGIAAAVVANGAISVLVNCAGIGIGAKTVGRSGPHDLGAFRKVIEVNLIGTFNVIRLVAEHMAQQSPFADGERGVIVNTASVAAFDGQIGQAAYSASKGGVVGMTLPIARDLADVGIRVCTIAPGIFMTPMLAGLTDEIRDSLAASVPFPKRLGEPSEYAQLAYHIVENHMLNGEVIRLDAALRMAPR